MNVAGVAADGGQVANMWIDESLLVNHPGRRSKVTWQVGSHAVVVDVVVAAVRRDSRQ